MSPNKRIVVNTAAQYTKAVINTLLSLYTVRLVLSIVGESDYGIMSIIMGIVGFLGFITNALVVTTQRHLSYDYGNKDAEGVRHTFSNCFSLHLIIGVALLVTFLAIEPLIVNDTVLNIAPDRWIATHFIYKVVTLILFITFITAPFKALLIARENIVFISAIEVLDGILKVAMVLCLPFVAFDKLEAYSLMMLCIFLFELAVYTVYDLSHFPECSPRHFFGDTNRGQVAPTHGLRRMDHLRHGCHRWPQPGSGLALQFLLWHSTQCRLWCRQPDLHRRDVHFLLGHQCHEPTDHEV